MTDEQNSNKVTPKWKTIAKYVWAVIAVGIIFSMIAAYGGDYFYGTSIKTKASPLDAITAIAEYDVLNCSEEFPVSIRIENRSTETIERTSLDLSVKREGFSSDINTLSYVSTDRIIEPSQAYTFCYKLLLYEQYERYLDTPEQLLFDVEVSNIETGSGNRYYR